MRFLFALLACAVKGATRACTSPFTGDGLDARTSDRVCSATVACPDLASMYCLSAIQSSAPGAFPSGDLGACVCLPGYLAVADGCERCASPWSIASDEALAIHPSSRASQLVQRAAVARRCAAGKDDPHACKKHMLPECADEPELGRTCPHACGLCAPPIVDTSPLQHAPQLAETAEPKHETHAHAAHAARAAHAQHEDSAQQPARPPAPAPPPPASPPPPPRADLALTGAQDAVALFAAADGDDAAFGGGAARGTLRLHQLPAADGGGVLVFGRLEGLPALEHASVFVVRGACEASAESTSTARHLPCRASSWRGAPALADASGSASVWTTVGDCTVDDSVGHSLVCESAAGERLACAALEQPQPQPRVPITLEAIEALGGGARGHHAKHEAALRVEALAGAGRARGSGALSLLAGCAAMLGVLLLVNAAAGAWRGARGERGVPLRAAHVAGDGHLRWAAWPQLL